MRMSYWMCVGIGIRTEQLYPYLNTAKCIELIKEQSNGEIIPDEEDFNVDDYLDGDLFDSLADMLCFCDDTDTLTHGTDGDGQYFFYYTPTYPWWHKDNEPKNIEEVHERIVTAVQKICDLTKEQIEELIDDEINELGCG